MTRISILIAVLIASASPAFGDVAQSSVKILVRAPECKTGPFGQKTCILVESFGSGTCVDASNGVARIVTCKHIFRAAMAAWDSHAVFILIDGRWQKGKCLGVASNTDLAVVEVRAALVPTEIDDTESSDKGEDAESVGFPETAEVTTRLRHRISGMSTNGEILTDTRVLPGTSGGGLFLRGRLRGVIVESAASPRDRLSVAIHGRIVRNLLDNMRIRCRCRSRSQQVIAPPVPPPPADYVPPIQGPSVVAGPKGDPGTPGERGPKGDAGPQGERGPAGRDADASLIATLQQRITVLESRPIKVQLIDESGAVVSEQSYAPGSPIKLRFNPVK